MIQLLQKHSRKGNRTKCLTLQMLAFEPLYVGVTSNPKWKAHCDKVFSKVKKTLGIATCALKASNERMGFRLARPVELNW